jgi:hypothetical protein
MRLFPFSLKERAKHWFHSLAPNSITSWAQLQQEFLKKYFSIGKTNNIRRAITSISQYEGEQLYETWERLKDLLRSCPHYAVPKCGKAHIGDCMTGSRACFRCGKPDQFARQWPTVAARSQGTRSSDNQPRPIAKAKVYMRTPDNVKADENVANVGTGAMLLIVVLPVSCLI